MPNTNQTVFTRYNYVISKFSNYLVSKFSYGRCCQFRALVRKEKNVLHESGNKMQLWVWGFCKPVIGSTGGPGGQNPWKICNI